MTSELSNPGLYRRRKIVNAVGLLLSGLSMALGLIGLLWILWTLAVNGISALDWNFFTKSTPAPGTPGGGLANALVGSLLIVGFATLLLVPARAVAALVRLAGSAEAVQMTATGSEFIAVLGEYVEGQAITGTTLRARLTEGRFPRWRDVDVSYTEPKSLAVAGDLLHAIDMASICTSESSKGVDLAITPDGLTISARAAEAGESRVECSLVEAGQPVAVKFDPHFASQWLSCGSFDKAEIVTIEARDAQSAVVLRCGDCRTVIMPMAAD